MPARRKSMNPREEKAIRHFLQHGNMAAAYKHAGYAKKNADRNAPKLFGRPHVKAYLDQLRAETAAVQDRHAVLSLARSREALSLIVEDALAARKAWLSTPEEMRGNVSPMVLSAKAVVASIAQLHNLGTFDEEARDEGLDFDKIRRLPIERQVEYYRAIAQAGGPARLSHDQATIVDVPLLAKRVS
jgi:hypothetical protein